MGTIVGGRVGLLCHKNDDQPQKLTFFRQIPSAINPIFPQRQESPTPWAGIYLKVPGYLIIGENTEN